MRIAVASVAALAVLLAGCGGPGEESPTASTPTPSPSATPYPTASPSPYEGPEGAGSYAGLELTASAFGPIELGMSVAQGREEGWAARLDHCDRWGANRELMADGVDLVFDADERLAEIWLGNPMHATDQGARVGMAVEEIAYLYGDRLSFEARDSIGATLRVPVVRDGAHELVFYAIGDKDEVPGPRAPVSAIGARTASGNLDRPQC